jgi:lipopolysaccharide/colanic/teichoic acid biosynthesis glycosyltransferase
LALIIIIQIIVNDGAVFYYQERPGLNGIPFKIIKFKSMRDLYNSEGELLPDGERITKFGKFLRNWSLDELLQLVNVIKGEMSLVGPRPLLMQYIKLYNEDQKRRHNVKPGITGWAQVSGRNGLTWQEKFEADIYYVENQSFIFDIKILIMTIYKVVRKKGISADGYATVEEFKGNKI